MTTKLLLLASSATEPFIVPWYSAALIGLKSTLPPLALKLSSTLAALMLFICKAPIFTVPLAFRVFRAERSIGFSGSALFAPAGLGGKYLSTLSLSMLTSKLIAGLLNLATLPLATMVLSSKRTERSAPAVSRPRSARALPVTGSLTLFIGICGLASVRLASIFANSNTLPSRLASSAV